MSDKPFSSGRELDPFRGFRNQLDSLFEDWFGRNIGGTLAPRINVSETGKDMTITVELPGVGEKDIDVTLSGNQLTVRGEKRSEQEEKKDDAGRVFHRVERSYGAFQRSMTVPFEVAPDRVSAQFKDGVLTIGLPKPDAATVEPRSSRIEVKRAT
jgi:HSP20 family protein